MNKLKTMMVALCCALALSACGSSDDTTSSNNGGNNNNNSGTTTPSEQPSTNTTAFVKGADVSWVTEMLADGKTFNNGKVKDLDGFMSYMKSLGVNSIRLRVWVDPKNEGTSYCDVADVTKKAVAARKAGMKLIIDFHYSDTWADPGNQKVPKAWSSYTFAQMKQAVSDHTQSVLSALKSAGVDSVEWVQVGNETSDGMLWNDNDISVTGKCSKNPSNFAAYITAGYNAAKRVYPKTKVVVHLAEGQNSFLYTWLFGLLKKYNASYDIIGMSLYPEDSNWSSYITDCIANIKSLKSTFGKDVIISEIGMTWNSSQADSFIKTILANAKTTDGCEGVFYWEPEVYGGWKPADYTAKGWNAYGKGAFDTTGSATTAFQEFNK